MCPPSSRKVCSAETPNNHTRDSPRRMLPRPSRKRPRLIATANPQNSTSQCYWRSLSRIALEDTPTIGSNRIQAGSVSVPRFGEHALDRCCQTNAAETDHKSETKKPLEHIRVRSQCHSHPEKSDVRFPADAKKRKVPPAIIFANQAV